MGHKRICKLLVDAMDTLLFLFFHLWSCLEWLLSYEFCSVYLWMPCALFVCTTTRSAIFLYLNYVIQSFCTGQSVRCLMRLFPLSCGVLRWVETISHWNTVRIEQKACSGYGISICYSIKFKILSELNRRWCVSGMQAQFEQTVAWFGYGSSIWTEGVFWVWKFNLLLHQFCSEVLWELKNGKVVHYRYRRLFPTLSLPTFRS